MARERGLERFVCEQPPYSTSARNRGRRPAGVPRARHGRHPVGLLRRRPSGRWRKGADDLTSRRSAMIPDRYDLSILANQAKLDAADEPGKLADEAGMTSSTWRWRSSSTIPPVTAAIIGPRTMEQLETQLGAVDVQLDDALLDRIDEIVAPGTNATPPTPAGRTRARSAARRR